MAMELPSSSWIMSIHASCSQMPTRSFRKSYTWWETHNHASATLTQHWCNSDATLKQLWRNSDAKSPEYEECEHDGPKSLLLHMLATQWRMISRFTVADDLKASSKITSQRNNFRRSSKNKVKPPWRINDYELTAPRNAKDERIQEVKRLPRKRQLFIRFLLVTSLRGRLLGIQFLFLVKTRSPNTCNSIVVSS